MKPLQGKYDWRDLKHWYDLKYSLPISDKLKTTDMQEGENKLVFGVYNQADVDPVTQGFLDACVPADAFRIEVVSPIIDD
ncbi:MAG: hypothetical protein ABI559_02120 [Chloroflexota bacterium]